MTDDRLFAIESVPEVPLFREPRSRKGPAAGSALDARFQNDYPASWHRCATCGGSGLDAESLRVFDSSGPDGRIVQVEYVGKMAGELFSVVGSAMQSDTARSGIALRNLAVADLRAKLHRRAPWGLCGDCAGMGSLKARVRLEAGHRCVRCRHPYTPKGDAAMLGVEPSGVGSGHMGGRWSACDEDCEHRGPFRLDGEEVTGETQYGSGGLIRRGVRVEAEWRILTVHHLDGDKANCRWWNLAALCQRCHLEIQAKVVMERVWPHEHSEWFKPYVAGYYAFVYLGEELTRQEVAGRLDELLALERAA